ncbi:MAG: hypothetical protein JW913_15255 [Chitinispirillaceae bacterium]|nr:hypothetical protein [Chitinispirillaceae bacterium]
MTPYAKMFFIVVAVFLAAGCGKTKESKPLPEPSKAVEDLTGMTAVKKGKEIKKKLNEAQKAQEERLKEIEEME